MEFVKIVPGEFVMGCSTGDNDCDADEKPGHQMQITKAFEIGKYEVTQSQWQAVMGSNPSTIKGEDHPVETVSKDDLLSEVWSGTAVEENNLTQSISALRKVLGEKRGLSGRDRTSVEQALASAAARIEHQRFVSPDYQHVQGTSVAGRGRRRRRRRPGSLPRQQARHQRAIEGDGYLTP